MKKQKIFKSVLSLIVMLSLVLTSISITAFAADGAAVPLEGNYTFLNVAYSPDSDVYVAVAKDLADTTNTPMKVLVSKNGYSWKVTKSFSSAKNTYQAASRQILTYWDAQTAFVVIAGKDLYSSTDGLNWKAFDGGFDNSCIITDNGTELVVGGNGKMRIFSSLNSYDEANYKSSSYAGYIAAKENKYFVSAIVANSTAYAYTITKTIDNETGNANYTAVTHYPNSVNANTSVAYLPYSNNHIMAVNTAKYRSIAMDGNPSGEKRVLLSDGTENTSIITAVGYANGVTYLGTVDGKVYYTEVTSTPTKDTVWSIAENVSSNTEEIRSVAQGKNGKAIVLSTKNVFLMENNSYKSISDYSSIDNVEIIGGNVFKGIKLLGGTYSDTLDRYIVYGNDADGKGCIFYSNDGINWNNANITKTHGFAVSTKNQAVWWAKQNMFVINIGNSNITGSAWYSQDGIRWNYGSYQLGDNGDITVVGDYLYSANRNSQRAIRKYSDLNTNEALIYSESTVSYNLNTIALSDDAKYIMVARDGYLYVYNPDKEKTFNGGYVAGNPAFEDAHWNGTINRFVVIASNNKNVYLPDLNCDVFGQWNNVEIESFVPNSSSGNLAAIETNGTTYLTGGENGTIYYYSNMNLSTTSTFSETAFVGDVANTMPVTNIFTGKDGKYYVTVSNGTDSDILVVTANGQQYSKVSENTDVIVGEGNKATVKIAAVNNTSSAIVCQMLVGIYNGNCLAQIEMKNVTIPASFNGKVSAEITFNDKVNSDSTVRVFLWDPVENMEPLCEASPFFE